MTIRCYTISRNAVWLAFALTATFLAPSSARAGFAEVGQSLGVIVNHNGLLQEDWGFGAAFNDFDGDGDLDLYVATHTGAPNMLFRQEPGGGFVDVAAAAGVDDLANGRSVKFADFDNDGDEDFFLGNFEGPNRLFRNDGDGTFTNVADSAIAAGNLTFGACWADYDNDGFVDLYVVNRRRGGAVPGINQLFHNQGDGSFVERAAELGVDDDRAGLEALWFDFDNDRDQDLYLSNDRFGGNRLWRNDGGTFTDVSVESGTNLTMNSMGVDAGDYNNDGYIDLYVTNSDEFGSIFNALLHNNGDGTFDNVAAEMEVRATRWGWGCGFLDGDNDGDLDLYVINASVVVSTIEGRNQYFRNNGVGPFNEIAGAQGVDEPSLGYGLCIGDFDDNGSLDMFVSNNKSPSLLYRNTGPVGRWLKVRTIGTESNRNGIGARVRVVDGFFAQIREISGGSSYLSQHSMEAHFGVGSRDSVNVVEVRWPSGCIDRLTDVAVRQTLTIVEGSSEVVELTDVAVVASADEVTISWAINRDNTLGGFRVYRADLAGGPDAWVLVNSDALVPKSQREYVDRSSLLPGHDYAYAVVAVDLGGIETWSQSVDVRTPVATFLLEQNYPNPFTPGTTIAFALTEAGPAKLTIHDAAGRLVSTLVNDDLGAGPYQYRWNGRQRGGSAAASGVYFYRLETQSGVLMRKMVRLK